MEAFLTGAATLVAIIFGLALAALAPLVLRGRGGNNNQQQTGGTPPPPAQPQPAGGNPPPAAPPQGGATPPPVNPTPPATGVRSLSLPRIPTWVFVVAITAALAYFFWPTLPSTDSIATTATEMGEKARVIGKDAGAAIVEKGGEVKKVLPGMGILDWASGIHPVFMLVLGTIIALIIFALADLKNTKSDGALGKAFITFMFVVVAIILLAAVGSFFAWGPKAPQVILKHWEENAANQHSQSAKTNLVSQFTTVNAIDTDWSEPLRVTGQYCLRANVLKHGAPKALAQVSTIEKPNVWFDLNGVENISIAWVRYKSKGPGPTEIQHELRPKALCN